MVNAFLSQFFQDWLDVNASFILLNGKWSSLELHSPFFKADNKFIIDDSANIKLCFIASNMNSNDSIIYSHRAAALTTKSADSVSDFEFFCIQDNNSVLSSETILTKFNFLSILVKGRKILEGTWESKHIYLLLFFCRKTYLTRQRKGKILFKLYWLLQLHYCIVERQFCWWGTIFELIRELPCIDLMVFFDHSIGSYIEFESCVLTLTLFVKDIVSSGENQVLRDENTTANTHLFIHAEKCKSTHRAVENFAEFAFLKGKQLLIGNNILVVIACLLISHFK